MGSDVHEHEECYINKNPRHPFSAFLKKIDIFKEIYNYQTYLNEPLYKLISSAILAASKPNNRTSLKIVTAPLP